MGYNGAFGYHNNNTLVNTGLTFKGNWDANTNVPFLQSGVGVNGEYYIVSVPGNTNLDGNTGWQISDWAIFEASTNTWQKINNSVISAYSFAQNQGTTLLQQSIIDFQGAGVIASNGVGKTIVTIPQDYSTIENQGVPLTKRNTLNFTGAGVSASDSGGKTIVNIPIQPAYSTIQSQGTTLYTQQPILNFDGNGVSVANGIGKTTVTINTISAGGTTNRLAMFTPNGTTLGNAPFSIGPSQTRPFGTNIGTNSINIGYNNAVSKTDTAAFGYDNSIAGTGQEVYIYGNRTNVSGFSNGVLSLGFLNTISTSAQGVYIIGDSNTLNTSNDFCLIFGENNTFTSNSQINYVGNNGGVTGSNNIRNVGNNNSYNASSGINTIGGFNVISNSSNVTIIGNSNSVTSKTNLIVLGNNNKNISIDNFANLVIDTVTGTKIGTATNQKLSFWNKTPIVQPTTAVVAATIAGSGGTNITTNNTFDGYTIAKVVRALRNSGLLA